MNTPLKCANGDYISVQASSGHYCSPRADTTDIGYGAVEVRINDDDPIGWVSASTLLEMIATRGGIIGGQLPPLNFGQYDYVAEMKAKGEEE